MSGLSRTSLALISRDAHLVQSVGDILSTATGTRVMRREYGSDVPKLIDAPVNSETVVDVFQAVAEALDRWEPRFWLRRVEILSAAAGHLSLVLTIEDDLGTRTIVVAA